MREALVARAQQHVAEQEAGVRGRAAGLHREHDQAGALAGARAQIRRERNGLRTDAQVAAADAAVREERLDHAPHDRGRHGEAGPAQQPARC